MLCHVHCCCVVAVMSDSFRPHGLQHARLSCPSPVSQSLLKLMFILSSVVPFSSCLQSSPASGSFPVSRFFSSGSQSIGASASASVPPMNIQDWFPLGLTSLISLQSKGLSRVFSNTTVLRCSAFFIVQLSHPYVTTGKTIALTRWTFVSKIMSQLFNMLSKFVIAFLPRSKFV